MENVLAATRDRSVVWLPAQPTPADLAFADGHLTEAADLVLRTDAEYAAPGFRRQTAAERLERARLLVDRELSHR